MKPFPLIIIFLLSINNAFSQGLIESSVYEKWNKKTNNWDIEKYDYNYNDFEYLIKENKSLWNETIKTWEPYSLMHLAYNEIGYETDLIIYTYNNDTEDFSDAFFHTTSRYEYNNLGKPIVREFQFLMLNTTTISNPEKRKDYFQMEKGGTNHVIGSYNWVLSKDEYFKTQGIGQEIIEIFQTCNSLFRTYELQYNPDGRYTGYYCYDFDKENNTKIPYSKISHQYLYPEWENLSRDGNFELQISPNPISNILNISINTNAEKLMSLEVFNYKGEKVMEESFNPSLNGELRYNVSNLPAGFYVAVVKDNFSYSIEKFVKLDARNQIIRP